MPLFLFSFHFRFNCILLTHFRGWLNSPSSPGKHMQDANKAQRFVVYPWLEVS